MIIRLNDKFKRISSDIFLNFIGSTIPLITLQLLIYPIVAKMMIADKYGEMQSTMALIYIVSGTIGNALSTTRLIKAYEYNENGISDDFNLLSLLCAIFIIIFIAFIILTSSVNIDFLNCILNVFIALLNFAVLYYQVGFRLTLNYKYIFYNKILAGAGYGVGFLVFYLFPHWQYIFILSLLLQILHCLIYSDLIRERIKRSYLFVSTFKIFINLSIATFLNKSLTYCDKLLLYPIFGGEAVAIYFTGNIFGKLMLQILEPMTNVILSYLAKEKTVSRSVWKTTLSISTFFCIGAYILFICISQPVLNLFYPQWADKAMELVPVCTLSLCISTMLNIITPFGLKIIDTNKQVVINMIGIVTYIILIYLLCAKYGLLGGCYALLLSYLVKFSLLLFYCFNGLGDNHA